MFLESVSYLNTLNQDNTFHTCEKCCLLKSKMGKHTLTISSKVLLTMLLAGDMLLQLNGRTFLARQYPWFKSDRRFVRMLRYLYRKGYITWEDKEAKRLVSLTKQGKLKVLLDLFDVEKQTKWDGKWRVVVYDIPQAAAELRFVLIHQLHRLSFRKLQASVYISPYALNEDAMEYLRMSGLIDYIRILVAERLDDDSDLRAWYKLPKRT